MSLDCQAFGRNFNYAKPLMFKFLRRAREATLLADCEKEIHRTAAANPKYVSVPRDVNARADLLQKAAAAGLTDHETVKRLDFLHRLVRAVTEDPAPAPAVLESLLAEGARCGFESISTIQMLRRYLDLERLKQDGPRVIARDQQGRAVYFQGNAEFKNKEGRFEV